jgi:hypothetical protein
MSCGRVCKTTPCSFPHCATSEQRESYREGYDDAKWDRAKQTERIARDDAAYMQSSGCTAALAAERGLMAPGYTLRGDTLGLAQARKEWFDAYAHNGGTLPATTAGGVSSRSERIEPETPTYDEGYNDGYDAALVAEDAAWQPFVVPALCVAAFAFGFIAAALLL